MKLFFSPGACSMASHLVLAEMGIPFDAVRVNLGTHIYEGGDYYKINSKGSVPALQLDNGEVLTEGAVILQYLADQKPEKHLVPQAGSMDRYRCQEWLNYIAADVHKGYSPLFSPKTTEEAKEAFRANLYKKLEVISKKLATNDYLMGHNYSIADAYLFTVLSWSPMVKVELLKFPALVEFMSRVKTRPATVAAMKAEGLLN